MWAFVDAVIHRPHAHRIGRVDHCSHFNQELCGFDGVVHRSGVQRPVLHTSQSE
jgi:hypothetical protein